MQASAILFDGATAADRPVTVVLAADRLLIQAAGLPPQEWPLAGLVCIDPPRPGQALRLSHGDRPGARLVITDPLMIAPLLTAAPQLRGGIDVRRLVRAAALTLAGLSAVALLGYGLLQAAPGRLAVLLPDAWRSRVGQQFEAALVEGARSCTTAAGRNAVSAMVARVAEGVPDLPPVTVTVYDIAVVNAFALPGERVVLTAGLIDKAETPEEVAGVLAHELGHVVNRHAEAQLVRATGLQVLTSLATGGGSDTLVTMVGMATFLRYSRGAEAEADGFALDTLQAAAIDPMGFRRFFERVMQEDGDPSSGAIGRIGSIFATHPDTPERISRIKPLPDGVVARPVLDDRRWQALKAICKA